MALAASVHPAVGLTVAHPCQPTRSTSWPTTDTAIRPVIEVLPPTNSTARFGLGYYCGEELSDAGSSYHGDDGSSPTKSE